MIWIISVLLTIRNFSNNKNCCSVHTWQHWDQRGTLSGTSNLIKWKHYPLSKIENNKVSYCEKQRIVFLAEQRHWIFFSETDINVSCSVKTTEKFLNGLVTTHRRTGLVQAVESYRLWPEGPGFESRSSRIAQARVRLATDILPQTPHRAGALCTGYALWSPLTTKIILVVVEVLSRVKSARAR